MADTKEVSYKCSFDDSHPTWSGIEGEIPTNCPECGNEGDLVEVEETEDEGATGETGPAEEKPEEVEVETAKYLITGLVNNMDEHGNVTGQFPVGSEQELPVFFGDQQVENGQATRVE